MFNLNDPNCVSGYKSHVFVRLLLVERLTSVTQLHLTQWQHTHTRIYTLNSIRNTLVPFQVTLPLSQQTHLLSIKAWSAVPAAKCLPEFITIKIRTELLTRRWTHTHALNPPTHMCLCVYMCACTYTYFSPLSKGYQWMYFNPFLDLKRGFNKKTLS